MASEAALTPAGTGTPATHAVDTAFEDLYLQHRGTVFHYLRGYCPDDDEALDLVAVTFERALVALRGPGLTGPPLPWLLRVARNAAIDRHRRQGTRRRLLSALGRLPERTARPAEDEVLEREDDRAFRRRLAALPDAQRDALALRYGADLTIADVAIVLGKSQDATQKLIEPRARATAGELP